MQHFDPNAAASKDSGIFGLPFTVNEAKLVLLPVPWEVTTSYGGGTSKGPQAIFEASKQVDLFDFELGRFYEAGIAMTGIPQEIQEWNNKARKIAEKIINAEFASAETINAGDANNTDDDSCDGEANPLLQAALQQVNDYSLKLNNYVYDETKKYLAQGKTVGLVGGDHSTPFGAIQAFLEVYPKMGILHFDAHADMRKAFEGFEHSHASIMYNVITKTSLEKLVQVGIRDFCEEEYDFIKQHPARVQTFFDTTLQEEKMNGKMWSALCDDIIQHLPQQVYISFDIDGLDPRFCPHTGTPVPGGLDFQEALYLIKKVVSSGRKVIGFDLNEVSPGMLGDTDTAGEWDANVGARLLYKLCGYSL
jgi:agmatinase